MICNLKPFKCFKHLKGEGRDQVSQCYPERAKARASPIAWYT